MAEPIPGRTTQPIGAKWVVLGCIAAALFLVLPCVAIVLLLVFGARFAARMQASDELLRVHREVLESEFDRDAEPKRGALLRELEEAREAVRRSRMGLFEWQGYGDSLRSATRDRRVTADEAEYMQRELDRLNRSIGRDAD
jgi:hypothetical protein